MNMDTIKEIDVKSVMTKSSLPVGGYSVNPYVGCPHACRYCYASFMKRFTGHTEPWGTFLDVKNWKPITNPHKYDGERVVIGSVTDGYNPYEEEFHRTRRLLEELRGSDAEIMICTKSDLVLRDLDLLKSFPKVTVSWSVNTLDEQFCADMDNAVSIERRLKAMRQTYEAGIRTSGARRSYAGASAFRSYAPTGFGAASSTSTKSTKSPARAKIRRLRAMSAARACSRHC